MQLYSTSLAIPYRLHTPEPPKREDDPPQPPERQPNPIDDPPSPPHPPGPIEDPPPRPEKPPKPKWVTRAAVFQPGAETETLARFSTVAGELGSPDNWREPRGFTLSFILQKATTAW